MAGLDDDDFFDDEQINGLITFPEEVQDAILQVKGYTATELRCF